MDEQGRVDARLRAIEERLTRVEAATWLTSAPVDPVVQPAPAVSTPATMWIRPTEPARPTPSRAGPATASGARAQAQSAEAGA